MTCNVCVIFTDNITYIFIMYIRIYIYIVHITYVVVVPFAWLALSCICCFLVAQAALKTSGGSDAGRILVAQWDASQTRNVLGS